MCGFNLPRFQNRQPQCMPYVLVRYQSEVLEFCFRVADLVDVFFSIILMQRFFRALLFKFFTLQF